MKFSEKLQLLRREKKLSQEQLADMLDVTRQSVSKWESGTTYPEMDKLIMICKIFECSLDDLTNDDVIDIRVKKKSDGIFTVKNFLDVFLGFVGKTAKMFQSMKFSQIVKCLFTMGLVMFVLLIVFVPSIFVNHYSDTIRYSFGATNLISILFCVFSFLVNVVSTLVYVMLIVYIFKILFLDQYQFITVEKEENVIKEGIKSIKTEKETIKEVKVLQVPVESRDNPLFKLLGNIILGFIKFIVACMSVPVVFMLVGISFGLAFIISLMFDGIVFFGVLLLALVALVACVWFLEIIAVFIFNKKFNFKRLLWTFYGILIGLGISLGMCVIEFVNLEYIDSLSENPAFERDIVEKEYEMTDSLYIDDWYGHFEFVEDENAGNNILVQIDYYKEFNNPTFVQADNMIGYNMYYYSEFNLTKTVIKDIKKNIKKKKIYNYEELSNFKVFIIGTKENLDVLKKNSEERESLIENFEDRIEQYESIIEEKDNKISSLEEEIEELEELQDED